MSVTDSASTTGIRRTWSGLVTRFQAGRLRTGRSRRFRFDDERRKRQHAGSVTQNHFCAIAVGTFGENDAASIGPNSNDTKATVIRISLKDGSRIVPPLRCLTTSVTWTRFDACGIFRLNYDLPVVIVGKAFPKTSHFSFPRAAAKDHSMTGPADRQDPEGGLVDIVRQRINHRLQYDRPAAFRDRSFKTLCQLPGDAALGND